MKPTTSIVNFFFDVLNKFKRLLRPNGFSNLKYQYIVIDKSPVKKRLNDIAKRYHEN